MFGMVGGEVVVRREKRLLAPKIAWGWGVGCTLHLAGRWGEPGRGACGSSWRKDVPGITKERNQNKTNPQHRSSNQA